MRNLLFSLLAALALFPTSGNAADRIKDTTNTGTLTLVNAAPSSPPFVITPTAGAGITVAGNPNSIGQAPLFTLKGTAVYGKTSLLLQGQDGAGRVELGYYNPLATDTIAGAAGQTYLNITAAQGSTGQQPFSIYTQGDFGAIGSGYRQYRRAYLGWDATSTASVFNIYQAVPIVNGERVAFSFNCPAYDSNPSDYEPWINFRSVIGDSTIQFFNAQSATRAVSIGSCGPTLGETLMEDFVVSHLTAAGGGWRETFRVNNAGSFISFGRTATDFAFSKTGGGLAGVNVMLGNATAFSPMQSLYIRNGSASPEGATAAPVGAIYSRSGGGAGTAVYFKETGTGNTGWQTIFTASQTIPNGNLPAALTGKTYNGVTLGGTGTLNVAAGKTLNLNNSITLTGTDGLSLDVGPGGTLGTAAFTASTAYQPVDADLTSIAALATTTAGRSLLTLASVTNLNTIAGNTANNIPITNASVTALAFTASGTVQGGTVTSTGAVNAASASVTGNTSTGTLSVGGGASITSILTASASLNFPSTVASGSSDLTITVTGAVDGDTVALGVPAAAVIANSGFTAYVSAADTVTVRYHNYSAAAKDPAAATFRVTVFHY